MITIEKLSETGNRNKFIKEFITYPKRIYSREINWIPWFDIDMKKILKKRHPFFLHSEGEFFLAKENDKTVGRICVVSNVRYQKEHNRKCAHFFFLDAAKREDVFAALLDAAAAWAKERKLEYLDGPMLFGGAYGSGVLIKGYEQSAPMTMMPYNYPYYRTFIENSGFTKFFDTYGTDISPDNFVLSEKITRMAEKVLQRGRFKVLEFKSKKEILKIADKIIALYNTTLADHPEDYPLTDKELNQLKKDLLTIASPDLIKILTYDDKIVGYLLAFADISPILHRNMGRITLPGFFRMMRGMKRSEKLLANGMAILPEYQRLGGNALLYYELSKTVRSRNFKIAKTVQINESTVLMLADIHKLGAVDEVVHRLYQRKL
ncbi:MAG: hypothetical protein DRP59_12490 [Spirochaetes bacterium]|nr:MAG: hypothetical protein DRP59_12490 [Spirochaetota bacterium]